MDDSRITESFREIWGKNLNLLPTFHAEVYRLANIRHSDDLIDRESSDAKMLLQQMDGKGWYEKREKLEELSGDDVISVSGYGSELRNSPMIFVPIGYPDWKRYDDIIDYYVAGRSPKDTVKLIDDDVDMTDDQKATHFIQTDASNGLTFENYKELAPFCANVFNVLRQHDENCPILWTSSHTGPILDMTAWLSARGVTFDYINGNPECPDTELCSFGSKFYFNILLDDKSGFSWQEDWKDIYELLVTEIYPTS